MLLQCIILKSVSICSAVILVDIWLDIAWFTVWEAPSLVLREEGHVRFVSSINNLFLCTLGGHL